MTKPKDSLKPFLPAYFKAIISKFELAKQPLDSVFTIDFVHYEHSPEKITVDIKPSIIWLLTQCDGSHSVEELLSMTGKEFQSENTTYLKLVIRDLLSKRVLLDANSDPAASPAESKHRYSRHNLFYAAHSENATLISKKLKSAKVAIIGVGGIGCWTAYLLAAAGVGSMVLIEGDTIEVSNLTRQMLFTYNDLGRSKVETAVERLKALNNEVELLGINAFCDETLLNSTLKDIDIMIVSGDEPKTLYDDISRFSVSRNVPWIRGGYFFDIGVVGPLIIPGITGCQKCLFDQMSSKNIESDNLPLLDELNNKYQVPSFGPINGVVASLLAKEVLMFLADMRHYCKTISSSIIIDVLNDTMEHLNLTKTNMDCYCLKTGTSQ